jgi:hypothetical protein
MRAICYCGHDHGGGCTSPLCKIVRVLSDQVSRREQEHQDKLSSKVSNVAPAHPDEPEEWDAKVKWALLVSITGEQHGPSCHCVWRAIGVLAREHSLRAVAHAEEIRKATKQGYYDGWTHRDTCKDQNCPRPSPPPPNNNA